MSYYYRVRYQSDRDRDQDDDDNDKQYSNRSDRRHRRSEQYSAYRYQPKLQHQPHAHEYEMKTMERPSLPSYLPAYYGHAYVSKSRDTTRNIRDMNNWCKYVNITHSIKAAFGVNKERRISVMDVACGNGVDLYKFRGNKKFVGKYLGIDNLAECVTTARKKYQRVLTDGIKHRSAPWHERQKFGVNNAYDQTAKEFYDGPIFDAQFICADMTDARLAEHGLVMQCKPFHLINIQFALQNAFKSKAALLALLNTIRSSTKTGSYLICSFVRDDTVLKRLGPLLETDVPDDDSLTFSNQFQSLRMKRDDFLFIKQVYEKCNLLKFDATALYEQKLSVTALETMCRGLIGIAYEYFQRDSVEGNSDNGGVQEFFVSFPVLTLLLYKHCGFTLVYKKTATDIYIESSRKHPYKYGYSKGRELDSVHWSKSEHQVIDTYGYALFQRS